MNYSELSDCCEKKKLQIKDVVDALGMTYTGLRDALNKDTLPIKKLLPLCTLLHISPNEFVKWGENDGATNITQTGMLNNQNVNVIGVDVLHEQLIEKDRQIATLMDILKNKLG